MSYTIIPLQDVIGEIGEGEAKAFLSSFSCPANKDVECFLREKAVLFNRQGIATTFLVFSPYRGENSLVGYFTLAMKPLSCLKSEMSRNMQDKIKRFSTLDNGYFHLASVLIAQLSKNFANGLDKLICGDVLLGFALDYVRRIQRLSSGRVTFLECEDKFLECEDNKYLREFYTRNGFKLIGKRSLDGDETNLKGKYLLRYILLMKGD